MISLWMMANAAAFTFPFPVADWAETERFCLLERTPSQCDYVGVANDTQSDAYYLGALKAGESLDSAAISPSSELWGGIFGSSSASLSHAGDVREATPSDADVFYRYDHPSDVLLGFEVDDDWYDIDTELGHCLEVCFYDLKGPKPVPTDWELTVYDETLTELETLTNIDDAGGRLCTASALVFEGSATLHVSDATPEDYGLAGTQPLYGFQLNDAGIEELWYPDVDVDGFGDANSPGVPLCSDPLDGSVPNNVDCNDDPTDNGAIVFPGAVDICDGIDNDCDNATDEDATFVTYWTDDDDDGFGDPATAVEICEAPAPDQVRNGDDCDDVLNTINPKATEVCDGVDNDCDGRIDEDLLTVWYEDADDDGFGTGIGVVACEPPGPEWVDTPGDCNDDNAAINPDATEICDGIDNDCDGQTDEDLTFTTYYQDADGDGFGDGPGTAFCTDPGDGWSTTDDDCDDEDATVNPGASEVCDGKDNDCNTEVDDTLTFTVYYPDDDADGFGDAGDPGSSFCEDPGAGWTTDNTDCDDTDREVNPDATEICNGIDDDCDTEIDEGLPTETWYTDADGDGFGTGTGEELCEDPDDGRVTNDEDCDDTNRDVHPDATEICNGIDDDCDTEIDEGFTFYDYYPDLDGDGYGDADASASSFCNDPGADWSLDHTDCDDTDASVNPGASEIQGDGTDQDCSGDDLCDQDGDGVLDHVCGGDDCDDLDASKPSEEPCQEPTRWAQGGIQCNSGSTSPWLLAPLLLLAVRRRR